MTKLLFIASLHHPAPLQRDRAAAQAAGDPLPVFPASTSFHFWEAPLRAQGFELDVFWRNLPGFGSRDISRLQAETYTERLTLRRILQALNQRLPYTFNIELRRRNALLLQHARQFQPDWLWLVGDNRTIHASTLEQLKTELGCKILYSTGTSPVVFSHAIEREAAPLYDLVLVNDYYHGIQWRELGAPRMECLPVVAMSPQFHYPRNLSADEQQEFGCDIAFVGTLLPANLYSERITALDALRDYDLGIWSVHDVPQSLQAHLRGSALGERMLRVLSAGKISLNAHGNFMRYGGNMRLFEAAGVGAFQLVDNRPGVHEWFTDGDHLVTYDNPDDLREKVDYYLAHPDERQRIALAGYQHVRQHHTYQHRLDRLLELGFG